MVWLSLDQAGLKALFDEWPSHIHDESRRKHLITVDEIELAPGTATVYSTFAVFRTEENGRSALFCIGNYEDQFLGQLTHWKLTARRVTVETRFLSTPTPIPL
jgi:3-phenylpropionate/cinnamic acid dioxygenase small subunit